MFCNYRNLFGEVNTGLHSYRLFNIAVVDVLVTLLFWWENILFGSY